MLLAEGWNSPRATVVMHLAPTASKRVYQQRIGRIMRIHPRKEAGIVVDFVPKGATHNERVVSLHSLLDADFYREGARVTPAPRRRMQRRARRKLTPALVARPGHARRRAAARGDPARVAARRPEVPRRRRAAVLGDDRRPPDALRRARRPSCRSSPSSGASKGALETFLSTCAAQNPNRRLRLIALADRVSMRVDRADFDDLVTLVTQAPPWEKDRAAGVRILLRAIAEGKPDAPDQILARWTWRLARAVRKTLDRKASQEYPDAKRLLGALANSRGHRHEENAARLVKRGARDAARGRCGAARVRRGLHAARDASCSRTARERLGTIQEIAAALADDLPAPKTGPSRSRRRRRRKKKPPASAAAGRRSRTATAAAEEPAPNGDAPRAGAPKRRRRRRKPAPQANAAPSRRSHAGRRRPSRRVAASRRA